MDNSIKYTALKTIHVDMETGWIMNEKEIDTKKMQKHDTKREIILNYKKTRGTIQYTIYWKRNPQLAIW